jgi:hypothetical protein
LRLRGHRPVGIPGVRFINFRKPEEGWMGSLTVG